MFSWGGGACSYNPTWEFLLPLGQCQLITVTYRHTHESPATISKALFSSVCVCLSTSACAMCGQAQERPEQQTLELELQVAGSCSTWLLQIELRSFGRVSRTRNCHLLIHTGVFKTVLYRMICLNTTNKDQ